MATQPSQPKGRIKASYKWAIVILLVALIVAFRLVEQIGFDRRPSDRFIVKKIIDGDTVELLGGDRLRLLSIDTPENGELFFDEACRFLEELSLGKTARIEYAGRRRDKYGRLLGYLYIDSIFVNKAILENGLGFLYLFEDTELERPQIEELFTAQRAAMQARVGIWSIERDQEDYYVAVNGSFRFHRPGCRYIDQLRPGHHRTFHSREEALYKGLSPCRRCKP
ncbi:MAG: thermonuclease family protein [Candidatus Zixiibacteriota bacterium]